MQATAAFLCGVLFALGLGVAGMTRPAKVTAFLDVTGAWDPSLALVMVGAIAVYAPLVRAVLRRSAPLLAGRFVLAARRTIDAKLLAGAAVFGVGWGLVGLCPGPAVTVLVAGAPLAGVFVAAMLAGMVAESWLEERLAARPPAVEIDVLAARTD